MSLHYAERSYRRADVSVFSFMGKKLSIFVFTYFYFLIVASGNITRIILIKRNKRYTVFSNKRETHQGPQFCPPVKERRGRGIFHPGTQTRKSVREISVTRHNGGPRLKPSQYHIAVLFEKR